jgi:hypothetical protein
MVDQYDVVVNLSGYKLPGKPPKELIEWNIEDPYRKPVMVYRNVRADLENRVMQLILRLRRRER